MYNRIFGIVVTVLTFVFAVLHSPLAGDDLVRFYGMLTIGTIWVTAKG